ncbi:MAG: hypothetical protein HYY93_09895 [Planctomycetes bacterium]|nr:hypothetical protein [Planctomycetota bacterium]
MEIQIERKGEHEAGGAFPLPRPTETDGMPVEVLLDRASFLRDTILHLVAQVRARRRIRDGNLRRIDIEQCETHGRLFQLPGGFVGTNKDVDGLRAQLETDHQRLELEKSREEAAGWKDIASLNRDLIEYVQEFRSLAEKLEILMGRPFPRPTFDTLLAEEPENDSTPSLKEASPPSEFQLRQLRRIP